MQDYEMNRIYGDEEFMWRALLLAGYGKGSVAPNPMVGAVIVNNGVIIGEGYHRCFGKAHAEVNAVASVRNTKLLNRSTLYVTLEPCSHYGKTPPCVELILSKKIPRVVIGCQDPFPKVDGNGITLLRNAGIEVTIGCLEKECKEIIRPFSTFYKKQRPYIILKWAQTANGYIDKKRRSLADALPLLISDPKVCYYTHKLRSEVDAIMVGTNTVILDNPSLTVRSFWGRDPLRITIDRCGRIPENTNLKDGKVKTLIFTEKTRLSGEKNTEYINLDFSSNAITQLLNILYNRNIQSLLIEGGTHLLNSFLNSGLWDEIRRERSSLYIKNGVDAPDVKQYIPEKQMKIGTSIIDFFYNRENK